MEEANIFPVIDMTVAPNGELIADSEQAETLFFLLDDNDMEICVENNAALPELENMQAVIPVNRDTGVEALIPEYNMEARVPDSGNLAVNNNASSSRATNAVDNNLTISKKKTIKKIEKLNYSRQKNQLLRQAGKQYEGLKYDKATKKTTTSVIPERVMGNVCNSNYCRKSSNRHCNNCPEDDRRKIFVSFWKLGWAEKRYYVRSLVDTVPPKKKTKFLIGKEKSATYIYNLRIAGRRQQVCCKTFLATLGIKEKQMKNFLDESKYLSSGLSQLSHVRRRKQSRDFIKAKKFVENQLDMLPKLPSHFGRETCDKIFLQGDFESIRHVHRFLSEKAHRRNIRIVSWSVFLEIFHLKKLSVYELKKDTCDDCELHRLHYMTDEEYEQHRLCVEEARKEKSSDKRNKSIDILSVIVDLQKILLCPLLVNGMQYYLCKLQERNYTIYDHHTKEARCKLWNETEGGVDASNFASLLISYLEERLRARVQIKIIIVWSDGCGAQNRNLVLSNALLNLAMVYNITIIQKYFVKGHSQSECDSVHARVETTLKNKRIYSPSMYLNVIANARHATLIADEVGRPPYEVETVDHTQFKGYDKVKIYSSIRPGSNVGDPTVNQIRALKYSPDGTMYYKLFFTEPWTEMQHRLESPSVFIKTRKYASRLPIKTSKFRDLQKLKRFIPASHHAFYDQLPHN